MESVMDRAYGLGNGILNFHIHCFIVTYKHLQYMDESGNVNFLLKGCYLYFKVSLHSQAVTLSVTIFFRHVRVWLMIEMWWVNNLEMPKSKSSNFKLNWKHLYCRLRFVLFICSFVVVSVWQVVASRSMFTTWWIDWPSSTLELLWTALSLAVTSCCM